MRASEHTQTVRERKSTRAPENATPTELFEAIEEPELADVPAYHALVITGEGAPAAPGFEAAIGALYGVAYTLKFARKKRERATFKVGVLVGEWRAAALHEGSVPDPDSWRWALELAVPADVTTAECRAAIAEATSKKGGKLEGSELATKVRLEKIPARRCVRMMHVGPYAAEPKTIERMRAYAAERGIRCAPWHIEVYCSDPRRTPASRLRTALLIAVV